MRQLYLVALMVLLSLGHAYSGGFDEHATCGFSASLSGEAGIAFVRPRPVLSDVYTSPKGYFDIHYTTVGFDAVPAVDTDGNGIPDRIDSTARAFDEAWEASKLLGYPEPPGDLDSGGSARYDIYVRELGRTTGWYGAAFPEQRIGVGAPYSAGVFTSFIEIDNDHAETDSVNGRRSYSIYGQTALVCTAHHEFHHAVQIGNYGSTPDEGQVLEMTAVWMEYATRPELLSWTEFIPSLMSSLAIHRLGNAALASSGYALSAFCAELSDAYGRNIVREWFESRQKTFSFLAALDTILVRRGSSARSSWRDFGGTLWKSGPRTDTSSIFGGIAPIPPPTPERSVTYSAPSAMIGGSMLSFENRFLRILIPTGEGSFDTLTVCLSSSSRRSFPGEQEPRRSFTLVLTPGSGAIAIGNDYYLTLSGETDEIDMQYWYSNGLRTPALAHTLPSPFKPQRHARVAIPVAMERGGGSARVSILNTEGMEVRVVEGSANALPTGAYLYWDGTDGGGRLLPSGVYVFTSEGGGKTVTGKVVIINE